MVCKFCKKEIEQPQGKRKKEFCNNTCRSNFWYNKNKKQVAVKDLNKPTNEVKPKEQPKTNYQINTKVFMNDAIRKKLGL